MRKVTVVKLDSKLVAQYRKVCKRVGWKMNHTMERVLISNLAAVEQSVKELEQALASK